MLGWLAGKLATVIPRLGLLAQPKLCRPACLMAAKLMPPGAKASYGVMAVASAVMQWHAAQQQAAVYLQPSRAAACQAKQAKAAGAPGKTNPPPATGVAASLGREG